MAAADSADAVLIRLGNGLGGFSGTTTLSVGDNPNDIVVGDFNNDGKQDFAVANFGFTDRSISVRLGDGLGGFGSATTVSVGGVPQGLAIGDLNNDGVQDIATANSGSDSVSIRLGNGTGGFGGTTEIGVSVAGGFPSSIIIADFNNDGNKDFATGNQLANTLSIRLGDGSGSFSSPLADLGVGVRPLNLAIGDFNKDGATDIATADIGSDFVSIRTGGCGAPTFAVVDGRVTTPDGRGLRNAVVSIIDSQSNRRTVTTSSFGVYSLANVTTGQTYTLTVSSKRYRFSPKVLQINGDLSNLDFVGLE